MAPAPFGARLTAAIDARGPLCVGIDPHPALLADWGLDPGIQGLRRFALDAVDAIAPVAAVVKPQSAFFETYGSAGIAVLETVIERCRDAGALVLLDVKRGDIGSTMDAYARAYLDDAAPLAVDAVTLSPFLGFGSLRPAVDLALSTGRGAFVLCRTSNQESGQVQRGIRDDGRSVAQTVVDEVAELNAGVVPLGSIGVVVGATLTEMDVELGALNGPILAPGLGAQGAGPAQLRSLFAAGRPGLLPSSSREILAAGPSAQALRAAVHRQIELLTG